MKPNLLLPDTDSLYQAFVQRDASYEGLFVAAVRTTGIFCRPTCTARKPRPENIEFFATSGEALAAGYRPCQRCHPLNPIGSPPDWLLPLWQAINSSTEKRWTTQDIANFGVDPTRVRRWFQTQYGMTMIAYLRARRLGQVFSRVQEGSPMLECAADADFDSVSGFYDALRRRTGLPTSGTRSLRAIKLSQTTSPLGPIMIAGDDTHVYLIEFWDRRLLESQFTNLEKRYGITVFPGSTPAIESIRHELDAYFKGQLTHFRTPLRTPGTPLQEVVWQALIQVPYGTTWTYRELAKHIGRPKAVRAVARAVGENRISIAVPCHRIIGTDGQLTGYGGGLWRKRYLLQRETESASSLLPDNSKCP